MNEKIQAKWQQGWVVGYDCITYGDGRIVVANTYRVDTPTNESKRCWFPLCDTTLAGVEKYDEEIWCEVDVGLGSFTHDDQTFVFGDGAMGNEGYVASQDAEGNLNWSIFFTFSNPIKRVTITDGRLICYGDTGCRIGIDLENIINIEVWHEAI